MTSHALEDRFSFTAFSQHSFFTYVNKWIVERSITADQKLIVDLGCGPGAVTRLILDKLGEAASHVRVVGVDPSASALERARDAIKSKVVEFVEGSAEWLSRLVNGADAVVFLNAIHLVPDKARVLREIRKVLRPGGVLAFNTTFFSGAYVEGTGAFWRRWIVRATQALRERGIEVQHSKDTKAQAMQWLTKDEYAAACEASGLRPVTTELVQIEMTPESMRDIGRFSLFIEGALPGVPLEDGAWALELGLKRAREETGVTNVPRYWLECVVEAT